MIYIMFNKIQCKNLSRVKFCFFECTLTSKIKQTKLLNLNFNKEIFLVIMMIYVYKL